MLILSRNNLMELLNTYLVQPWRPKAISVLFFPHSSDTSNIPDEFVSIVSDTARNAIVSLVTANSAQDDLNDDACSRGEGNFRCPLGACLNATQVGNFLFQGGWILEGICDFLIFISRLTKKNCKLTFIDNKS